MLSRLVRFALVDYGAVSTRGLTRFHIPPFSRVEDWRRLPRRLGLSVAPRFLWECLTSRTVGRFPAPAASNPAGGFPALGFPACFTSRVMGPILLVGLSA
jgi:hypothetical protein